MYVPDDVHAILIAEGGNRKEWENQCGGYACIHRSAQGTLQKLNGDSGKLLDFFTGGKYHGWCDGGIDAETADFIEQVVPEFIVDRDNLDNSCEAWILGTVNGKYAVLVWENSD